MRPFSRWTGILCVATLFGVLSCSSDGGGDPVEPEAGSVRATVTGDGDPLPGVTVRLFANGGATALVSQNTAANGQTTFAELDPGQYDVEVVVLAGFELAPGQALREDVTVEEDATANVTFELQEIVVEPTVGQIRARVLEDGAGLAEVEVILFEENNGPALDTLDTGLDGRVLFVDLAPGDYEVGITLPDGYEMAGSDVSRKDVSVTAGAISDVEFEVEGPPSPTAVEIDVASNTFSPGSVTVPAGTLVRWILVSGVHTVTPDGHSEWGSVTLEAAGEEFEHTFNTPGEFPYFCAFHAGMTGTVTVQ